jgi:two-component system, OmpR family, copper resistance phosphate regulon response regulator CusR
MRILIVDDDDNIRHSLAKNLEAESFIVDTASDGEAGSYAARTNEYDAIILDLIMPKKDGTVVCREIRLSGKTCPIIMLSVNAVTDQKVSLLNTGADDYLTKPFSYKELSARLRALLRRPPALEPDILEIDDLRVDIPRQRVTRSGKEIYLTRKEFALLAYLMRHKSTVVSRGMIMEHVWSADHDPFSNTIEAHILNIRKKISVPKRPSLIHTITGRGYKLDVTGWSD